MQRQLIDYIRRPDSMDARAVAHLRDLVARYPYFHSARILLLQALYRSHDAAFNAELRAASLMIPNRQAIFHLVEEKNYSVEEERKKFDKGAYSEREADVTTNLIDQFLQSLPQEPVPNSPMPVDATQDYIGYLLQTEQQSLSSAASTAEAPALAGGDIIEDFLEKEVHRITLSRDDEASAPRTAPAADVADEPQANGFLTETLAGIYIRQGKYEQAAKIIRQIFLNNPKKSRYFADQLRFLEKLIINNKNK